jgi:hypothetical protein
MVCCHPSIGGFGWTIAMALAHTRPAAHRMMQRDDPREARRIIRSAHWPGAMLVTDKLNSELAM